KRLPAADGERSRRGYHAAPLRALARTEVRCESACYQHVAWWLFEKLASQAAEQCAAQLAAAVPAERQQLRAHLADGRIQAIAAFTLAQAVAQLHVLLRQPDLDVFDELVEQFLLQGQVFRVGGEIGSAACRGRRGHGGGGCPM